MKEYSFLSEAETYVGGDNFFKDAYQAMKFGFDSAKDGLKNKVSNFSKNNPKLYKYGGATISAGSAGYSYYLAVMNGLMAKKITTLIHDLEDPAVDTRIKAASIFINLGYIKDDLVDLGGVKSISVNQEVSSKIVGPVIQIIRNPEIEDWKNEALKYLKRQRMILKMKAGIEPVVGTVTAAGIAKYFKK